MAIVAGVDFGTLSVRVTLVDTARGRLGSEIFAAVAAGEFFSIEVAQEALCPQYRVVEPNAKAAGVYQELYALYRDLYFGQGKATRPRLLSAAFSRP